ncbi:MAG: oxidoreductase [Burkholderiales bacterium PBB5]|nr:MAG: oxidoreductase [Burkholderiales bacterium PBB5]
MKQPLRIGLVGAGWVTAHHLAGWRALEGRATVVAIADPNTANAHARAQEHGIAQVFDSAQAMFDGTLLDAVDVAAPREFHAAIVRQAARRGLAVLCQKPLAPTLDQAQALVDEVAPQCRLMVHENWRFRPYYRDLAGWLAEGRIGSVQQASMTLLTSGLLPDAEGRLPALQRQPFLAQLDRALVMEILIHHIDTLRYLLGELTLVHARLGRSSAAMRGEDRAFLSFETESQAPVALLANLSVHGRPPAVADRLTLVGSDGSIELEGDTLRCFGARPAELRYDLAESYAASYAATIAHFVDSLHRDSGFETSPADNLRSLALVEAAYRQAGLEQHA